MAIPISNTLITVERPADLSNVEPWGGDAIPDPTVAAEDVRAVINVSVSLVAGATGPGDSESVRFTLLCDPVDLNYQDVVLDQVTGTRYAVTWAVQSPGIGGQLASTKAGLTTYQGFGQESE